MFLSHGIEYGCEVASYDVFSDIPEALGGEHLKKIVKEWGMGHVFEVLILLLQALQQTTKT